MEQSKLKNISRLDEIHRQNSLYEYYNRHAYINQEKGILLTDFKTEIAVKFSYKSYQGIANVISKLDSRRRKLISEWLDRLYKELFVIINIDNDYETESEIEIKKGDFQFFIKAHLTYQPFEDKGNIPDYGIKTVKINLIRGYHNEQLMFLSKKDTSFIEEYFEKRIIFDLIP